MPSPLLRHQFKGIYATTTVSTTTVLETTTTVIPESVEASTETMANSSKYVFEPSENIPAQQIITEEVLRQVNYLVQRENKREEIETSAEATEAAEAGPLFGQVEAEAQSLVNEMIATVQKASAAEVITLLVGIVMILYWLDRGVKLLFQYAIRKNHGMRNENGEARRMRAIWTCVEIGLEKIWLPLWCVGNKIREDALANYVDDDNESAMGSSGIIPPNNTMVNMDTSVAIAAETPRAPSNVNDDANDTHRR
jgi:hypothetical protein